jgi:hypothetical protein
MIPGPCTLKIFPSLATSFVLLATVTLLSCTPRVEVAVPDKPITINLNIKIDHEVRVKVDKDLEDVFSDQSELF